jgi:hypothetical protein
MHSLKTEGPKYLIPVVFSMIFLSFLLILIIEEDILMDCGLLNYTTEKNFIINEISPR